ncbi:MAG: hypothetical protein ACK4XY_05745 [Chloroherpetonaceae bacterium]
MKHDARFEARLRNNLLRLWLAGVVLNTLILFSSDTEKLPMTLLLFIALILAGLNAGVSAAIYLLVMRYKRKRD